MPKRLSLNRHAPWHVVLPLLDIPCESTALPLRVSCPCCGKLQLTIYQDSQNNGAWHHCTGCGTHGDIIELAARAWKLDLPDAIRRLASLGVAFPEIDDIAIEQYVRLYPEQRARAQQLVEQGRTCLSGSDRASYAALFRRLKLKPVMNPRQWQQRMGAWIGGATKDQIEVLLRPGIHRSLPSPGWAGGHRRIFRGAGWKHVLVIPFHDMPGRIANFLFIGRQCLSSDRVFRLLRPRGMPTRAEARLAAEAGICLYSAATQTADHKEFGNDLLVCQDPLQAIKLQARHLRAHTIPLPVVGAYDRDIVANDQKTVHVSSDEVWQTLPDRSLIFWGSALSPAVVTMAAKTDGRIALCAAAWSAGRTETPREWFLRARRQARPWDAVLDGWLREASQDEARTLLAQLDLPDEVLQDFRRKCSEGTRVRLERFETDPRRVRIVNLGKKTVMETPKGWIDGASGVKISSAALRIDRLLYQETTDEVYYQGTVLFEGRSYPFLERQAVVDKGTFSWMRKHLIANGGGIMTYDATWTRHAIDIAILLHNPSVERGVGAFGWRGEKNAFVLPRFRLPLGGQPQECEQFVLDDVSPAVGVLPDRLKPPNCRALTADSPAHQAFWATAAALGANILAPGLNQRPAGVGLLGDGAVVLGRMTARLWGCAEYEVKLQREAVEIAADLRDRTTRHSWPLLLTLARGKKRTLLAPWLHAEESPNAVLDVDAYLADALRTQARWRFVSSDAPLTAAPAVGEFGQQALFSWLLDICRRRLQLRGAGELSAQRVLHDMAVWAENNGGDPQLIRDSHQLIDEADDEASQAGSFVALLYRCIDEGALTFKREGFDGECTPQALMRLEAAHRPAGVFVPRAAVNKVFADRGVPVPDPAQLTRILAEAGGLECEHQHDGMSGWLLNLRWWSQQVERCHAQQRRVLRIVS